jgi:hypothetical protein
MGEIDHAHDAEDQRQPDTEEGVGTPEDQGVESVLEELVHALLAKPQGGKASPALAWRGLDR